MQYVLAIVALVAVVGASPLERRQAVTAAISPSAPAPSGCLLSTSGSFGIAVQNVTSAAAKRQVTQGPDGQPAMATMAPVSMISDGQVQGGMHTMVVMPVNQITDGQVQQATVTMAPVTAISDGQPQAPQITVSSTITPPVSQISDAQPQAPTSSATQSTSVAAVSTPVSSLAATSASSISVSSSATSSAASSTSSSSTVMVACASNSTLELTLANGILKDAKGRTGYIASNYQFQFDSPPQAGSIYTAGFSVCSNGSLALGGSTIFYQCLSGGFYNLYSTFWAEQCSPVYLNILSLVTCS